jgi:hypothetical protein
MKKAFLTIASLMAGLCGLVAVAGTNIESNVQVFQANVYQGSAPDLVMSNGYLLSKGIPVLTNVPAVSLYQFIGAGYTNTISTTATNFSFQVGTNTYYLP